MSIVKGFPILKAAKKSSKYKNKKGSVLSSFPELAIYSALSEKGGSVQKDPDRSPRIVLTASRAEMSDYGGNPFKAFMCTFPEMFSAPRLSEYLEPQTNSDQPSRYAPYGLRKVESLLKEEVGENQVVVVHPDNLGEFVGEDTDIVGISTMDPLGLAYVSTTYNSLIGFGGDALNMVEFERLLDHPVFEEYDPTVIVGGAGVWQIREAEMKQELGIDILYEGPGGEDLLVLVEECMDERDIDAHYTGDIDEHEKEESYRNRTPLIQNPASYGTVEITRGCGRGCAFCSPNKRKRHSFPKSQIMDEVATNIDGGTDSIFTVTEDIFLYRCDSKFRPNTDAIVDLYESIASYPGVEYIHLSHASLAPVLCDQRLLDDLTPTLMEKTFWNREEGYDERFITAEVGIESGSVRLMKKYMEGKALPFDIERWPEIVCQAIGEMNDHGWKPLCTFMTGLPDETEDDVMATLELLDDLRNQNAEMFYTPLLFIPFEGTRLSDAKRSDLDHLLGSQWEVITRCWRNNIEVWDPDKAWLYRMTFFFGHWFYARWKHGRKATLPMMRLSGLADEKMEGSETWGGTLPDMFTALDLKKPIDLFKEKIL